ncbi:MAG: flagellar motor switch protein FliM [Stellaceae bacterium]
MSDTNGGAGGAIVRPYNLFVQEQAAPARMPTLEVVNDRFARALRVALFHHLRKGVELDSGTIELIKHFELIERLKQPSYMVLVGLKPLRGTMLMIADAQLVIAIVESRFGGNGRFPVTKSQRDFTTVEIKVMNRVVGLILEQFAAAWQRIVAVEPEVLRYEFNPQFAGISPAGEVIVTITFKIRVDNGEGTLMVCIPSTMLAPVHDELMSGVASDPGEPDGHWFEQLKTGIEEVMLPVRVELTEIEMTVNDLLELRPGHVFEIDRPQSVVIEAEGIPLFRGRWGRCGRKSAVRIEEPITPVDDALVTTMTSRSQ